MSEAKQLRDLPPQPPLPKLVDTLPPIPVCDGSTLASCEKSEVAGHATNSEHSSHSAVSASKMPTRVPRRRTKSNRWLTRMLLITGCVFVFFGLGVAVAAMILSGSLDLKGLTWIKELLRQIIGK